MVLGQGARHAGLIQGLISPSGILLWLSGVLPGSAHDITAAREQVLPAARPYLKNLPIPADSGYEGAGPGVHVPVKKPHKSELGTDTITRDTLLRTCTTRENAASPP